MKNKEIEELLNMLKKEDNYWSEEKHDYPFPDYYSLNREDLHLLLSYIEQLEKENDRLKKDYSIIVNENCDNLLLEKKVEQLENNRDKAIEYANNCLNNINDCVKNGNYTIKELTSWVPTLQCVHNSYLKILKGDSE